MKTLTILFAFFASSSVAIMISDHNPKDTTIRIEKDKENFDLSCQSDEIWKLCEFSLENGKKSCKVEWDGNNSKVRKCSNKVIQYMGYARKKNCTMKIKVQGDIGGQWTCKLSDANSNLATEFFNVEIQEGVKAKGKATDHGTNGIEVIRNAILIFTFGVTSVLVIGCVLLLPQLLKK